MPQLLSIGMQIRSILYFPTQINGTKLKGCPISPYLNLTPLQKRPPIPDLAGEPPRDERHSKNGGRNVHSKHESRNTRARRPEEPINSRQPPPIPRSATAPLTRTGSYQIPLDICQHSLTSRTSHNIPPNALLLPQPARPVVPNLCEPTARSLNDR